MDVIALSWSFHTSLRLFAELEAVSCKCRRSPPWAASAHFCSLFAMTKLPRHDMSPLPIIDFKLIHIRNLIQLHPAPLSRWFPMRKQYQSVVYCYTTAPIFSEVSSLPCSSNPEWSHLQSPSQRLGQVPPPLP
jgi:hypothetical protein